MAHQSNSWPLNERHARIMRIFAQKLKLAREGKYRSAEQLANVLGLHPHAYRKYERGESEPNYDTLTRICNLLEVTPNDLLPDAAGAKGKGPRKAGRRLQAA